MKSRPITPERALLKSWLFPETKRLRAAWLCAVASAVLFVGQSYALAQLFATWLADSFAIFSKISHHSNIYSLNDWLAVLIVCALLRPLLGFIKARLGFQAACTIQQNIRQTLIHGLANLGGTRQYFGNDGELSSRLTDQIDALDGYISRFYVQKMVAVSTPIILLIAVATQSWLVVAIFCGTLPVLVLFMAIIGNLTAKQSTAQLNALAQLSGRFLDWIRGLPTVQRIQAQAQAEHDLAISAEEYRVRTMKVLRLAFLNNAVLELMASVSIALVAVYLGFGLLGILPWAKNSVPVDFAGSLFLLLLAPEFYAPLRQLGADYHAKAQAESAAANLLPLWNAVHQSNNNMPSEQSVSQQIHNNPPEIIAENITIFGAEQRIRLANFNAHIKAGSRVVITGASGSGKSSVLQMLLGFAPFSGSLKINGQDFAQINLTKWRQQIGYLAQSTAFLPNTIAVNLRLANPTASDDDLIHALQAVELWHLIKQLPQGLHTPLGEHGRGLSGGQLQRLALAQLILRDSSVWLLDEPTEHLDPDTASRLHDLLARLSQGKTVLWVSHHSEQLGWCDEVIGLEAKVQAI